MVTFLSGNFAVCIAQYQRSGNRFQQLNPRNNIISPHDKGNNVIKQHNLDNNVISQHGRGAKRCYVCTGKFPDRDCELYPKYTQVCSQILVRRQQIKMQFSYLHFKHSNILRTSDELSRSNFFWRYGSDNIDWGNK